MYTIFELVTACILTFTATALTISIIHLNSRMKELDKWGKAVKACMDADNAYREATDRYIASLLAMIETLETNNKQQQDSVHE